MCVCVSCTTQIASHTVRGILRLVERERSGEAVDRALLTSLVRLFNSLGLYSEALQRPLLEQAQLAYKAEGERLVQQLGVAEYLAHCEVSVYMCVCVCVCVSVSGLMPVEHCLYMRWEAVCMPVPSMCVCVCVCACMCVRSNV